MLKKTVMNGNGNGSTKHMQCGDEPVIISIGEDSNVPEVNEEAKSSSWGRNNSYYFEHDDPPTKLIGNFLKRQEESGNFELDPATMDEGEEELTFITNPKSSVAAEEEGIRSRKRSPECDTEVIKSPSKVPSKTYIRASSKSRLSEPQSPPRTSTSARKISSILKSSQQQQNRDDEPEKDPLDVPDRYSRNKKWDMWAYLQWAGFLIFTGGLVCTTCIPDLQWRKFLGLHYWRWAVLILVIFCGRLVSGWFIHIFVFFIERNFLLRKRVLYFVYGLQKGVQNCLWFTVILLAWRIIFDPNVQLPAQERNALNIVTKILICFLVAAFLWLLKILLVKVLALSFHVNTYFDRIHDSLFNQYTLETLSGPPLLELQQAVEEAANLQQLTGLIQKGQLKKLPIDTSAANKSGAVSAALKKSGVIGNKSQLLSSSNPKEKNSINEEDNTITIDHLRKLNHKNVSAWNMKRLIKLVKQTGISTLAQSIEDADGGAPEEEEIRSEWQAKVAAKRVFKNVARPTCNCITFTDLMRFLQEEEAVKAFALFDGAIETGKITKQSLINWVVNVYRERRALSYSLNDTKTAVDKLHRIIDAIMAIIILIISLLILGIATTHLLVLVSSQLVLIAFVFGNTCKTVFEAIIFLFAMHPFDVGDRCVVDGIQMVVEEMNILTTVFLRYDNEKIYYPNSVLATKPISNFYRSPDMGDFIDFSIHISTSTNKIQALKSKIAMYIESHPHHWYAKHDVVMKEIEDMNRIRMSLWLQHTMNHQNAGEKWIRRSDLLMHLRNAFQELAIDYRLLPQQIEIFHKSVGGGNT